MKWSQNSKELGFFTRLLDEAAPAERYRLAAAQIGHAEKAGSILHGSRSIIFMKARVGFPLLSLFSALSPRRRLVFVSGPASSRCRWKIP